MRLGIGNFLEEVTFPQPPRRKTVPVLDRFWWFWRFYGYVFYQPLHKAWRFYSHCRSNPLGGWIHRFKSYPAVREWLWGRGTGKALVKMRLRYFLHKLLQPLYHCVHCGFDCWFEDEIFTDESMDTQVPTFECVDSGSGSTPEGEYHWWEGWKWCYRCGHYEWHSDST